MNRRCQPGAARAHARCEALRLMNYEVASAATHGSLAPQDASAMKVYGTELNIEVLRALIEIVGPAAHLADGAPGALLTELDHALRGLMILTFGGGTNELQRDPRIDVRAQVPAYLLREGHRGLHTRRAADRHTRSGSPRSSDAR